MGDPTENIDSRVFLPLRGMVDTRNVPVMVLVPTLNVTHDSRKENR